MALHARGYIKPHKPKPKQRWRPPRGVVLDEAKQFAIRHSDLTGWRVVDGNGVILADNLASNREAWAWIDDHGDKAMEIVRDRVANAFRKW